MGWRLTLTARTPKGVEKQVYTHEHARSPVFASGFICGWSAAHGLSPEHILLEYEEIDD